jgi:hypothetical protein
MQENRTLTPKPDPYIFSGLVFVLQIYIIGNVGQCHVDKYLRKRLINMSLMFSTHVRKIPPSLQPSPFCSLRALTLLARFSCHAFCPSLLQHMPAFVFMLFDFKRKNKTVKSCPTALQKVTPEKTVPKAMFT